MWHTVRRLLAMCCATFCVALQFPAAAADSADRSLVSFPPTRSMLVLIPGNGEAQNPAVSRFVFLAILTQTWQVLLHPIAVAVRDELAKYATASSASAS